MTGPPDPAAIDPLFTHIDHVGIAVPDLDEAIAFYARAFGMAVVHQEVNEEQGVREAMLGVGDGAARVQLLAPLRPDSAIARFLDRSGPGSSRSPMACRTSRRPARSCVSAACACSMTLPGAAPQGR